MPKPALQQVRYLREIRHKFEFDLQLSDSIPDTHLPLLIILSFEGQKKQKPSFSHSNESIRQGSRRKPATHKKQNKRAAFY